MPHSTQDYIDSIDNIDNMAIVYLKRDEFIDYRNVQDAQLNVEFRSIRDDVASFRNETKENFKAVRDDIHGLQLDLPVVKEDLSVVKQDLSAIKEDVSNAKEDLAFVKQDLAFFKQETRQEFKLVRDDIDRVQKDLSSFKEETKQEFKAVRQEIGDLRQEIGDLRQETRQEFTSMHYESKRQWAWMRNAFKKNPILRIEPMPIFHPTEGILEPDPRFFPRNAKDFYALRNPNTPRRKAMLQYLLQFYDIKLLSREKYSEAEDDDIEEEEEENPIEVAIEQLEGILGLQEENFLAFMERAAQRARKAEMFPVAAPKRQQMQAPEGEPLPQFPRMDLEAIMRGIRREEGQPPSQESEDKISFVHVGWRTHSTTSSEKRIVLPERANPSEPRSEHGVEGQETPTNRVTSPDSARIRGE